MSKKIISIIGTLVVLFSVIIILARPAFAISNGEEDEYNEYSNVGALVYHWKGDPAKTKRLACSGVLIDPEIFLTAGHCYPPSELVPYLEFFVTFDEQYDQGSKFIKVEEFIVDPEFGHDMGMVDLHDIAVIRLDKKSTRKITPADLPPLGLLDEMSQQCGLCNNDFVNVGYGVVPDWKKGPVRYEPPDGWRRVSTSPFMALTKSWLKLLMNYDATDQGGVCYGDSGGPHFLSEEESNMLVAITTGGDMVCRALNYNYRLDTQTARDFLGGFVDLP